MMLARRVEWPSLLVIYVNIVQILCDISLQDSHTKKYGEVYALENPVPLEVAPGDGAQKGEENMMAAMVASMRGAEGGRYAEFSGTSASLSSLFPLEEQTGSWHVALDNERRFLLSWAVDYAGNRIIFQLHINKTVSRFRVGSDLFALGFSPGSGLASSDFCVIWFDLAHRLQLQDARTDSRGRLELLDDESRGACKLVVASSTAGRHSKAHRRSRKDRQAHRHAASARDASAADCMEIAFERPLDVCKAKAGERYTIDNGTTNLVWFAMRGPLLTLDGLQLDTEAAIGNRVSRGERTPTTIDSHEVSHGGDGGDTNGVVGAHLSSDDDDDHGADDHHHHDNERMASFEWGLKRVQLIASRARRAREAGGQAPADVDSGEDADAARSSLELRMEHYRVPARETTYWCKLFKLPKKFQSRRYHITSYGAVIEPAANERVVHHMELFNCANLNGAQEQELRELLESKGGWSGDCNDATKRPRATEACRKVIMAWAMGAHPLEYPEQVGQSIGGPGYSPYVVLEVHYNNVDSRAGLVDESGLKFHYTPKLRPYDAGILEVGLEYTDKNSIPPNLITPMAGHCVSECTRAALSEFGATTRRRTSARADKEEAEGEAVKGALLEPDSAIYVFAAQMHTHLAGVASWTEHIRGGQRLAELQRDNHYSPHFQEIRLLPEPVRVEPGDALVHYCLYDTRQRPNITLGGFATSDEMCVTYLHYYPRIDLEVCKSSVDTRALEAYFAYLKREERQPTSERLSAGQHGGLLTNWAGESANNNDDDDDDHRRRRHHHHDTNKGRSSLDRKPDTALAVDGHGAPGSTPAALDLDGGAPMQTEPRSAHGPSFKSVSDNYRSIEWSPRRSQELIQFLAEAPLSVQCNRSNGARLPGQWDGLAPTRVWPDERREWAEGAEPPWRRPPASGHELIAYRGRESGRRHAQCATAPAG